jgi:hypothetical protein
MTGRGSRDRQTRLGSDLPSRKTLTQSGLTCPEYTSKIGMAIFDPHLFRNTIFDDLWIIKQRKSMSACCYSTNRIS